MREKENKREKMMRGGRDMEERLQEKCWKKKNLKEKRVGK